MLTRENWTRVYKKQVWTQYFTFHSKLLDLLVNFSILSLVPELLVTKTNEHINTYQQTWAACNKAVAGKNVKTWSVMSSGICSHTQDILLLAIIHVGKYFISVCIHLQHINIIYHWLINSSLTMLNRQLWSWSYGIVGFTTTCRLYNQYQSPLKLWVWIPLMARCTRYNIMW